MLNLGAAALFEQVGEPPIEFTDWLDATDETPEYLPLSILLAHRLNSAMSAARRSGRLPWLRP